jgi:hypothetical protein
MATRRRSSTEENITATTDGQGTINYQNNDLAARLARYRSRTGEYAKTRQGNPPSQGSNFTIPTAGQRTERKTQEQRTQAGQEYAARYRANAPQRKAQGAAYRAQEAKRRDEYANTGRVTTGVNPPRVYRPANQGATAMGPQTNPDTYTPSNVQGGRGNVGMPQRPSMFGASSAAYDPLSSAYQPGSPMAPTMPQAQAGGYQAPSPFRNYDQFGRDYQSSGMQFMNPWGRRW